MYEPNAKAGTRKVHLEYNAVEVDVAVREIILDDEDKTLKKVSKDWATPPFSKSTQYFSTCLRQITKKGRA